MNGHPRPFRRRADVPGAEYRIETNTPRTDYPAYITKASGKIVADTGIGEDRAWPAGGPSAEPAAIAGTVTVVSPGKTGQPDSLFDAAAQDAERAAAPLAVRMRPRTLDEVIGQRHLI